MLSKSTDYGLPTIDKSLLRIANTEDTEFLQQAELKAIKEGLEYLETERGVGTKFRGYIDQNGDLQGVGIGIGVKKKTSGEFLQNKLHGIVRIAFEGESFYWGEFKND
jgi:hypothetical protein